MSSSDGLGGLAAEPGGSGSDVQLAVPRLAAALLRHKSLSGAEVEDIVRDCGVTCERAELPLGWPDSDEDEEGEAFSWGRW